MPRSDALREHHHRGPPRTRSGHHRRAASTGLAPVAARLPKGESLQGTVHAAVHESCGQGIAAGPYLVGSALRTRASRGTVPMILSGRRMRIPCRGIANSSAHGARERRTLDDAVRTIDCEAGTAIIVAAEPLAGDVCSNRPPSTAFGPLAGFSIPPGFVCRDITVRSAPASVRSGLQHSSLLATPFQLKRQAEVVHPSWRVAH